MRIPTTLYGPDGNGLLDPRRLSPTDRRTATQARLNAEHARRNSLSPEMARLQQAADHALGRSPR